MSVAIFVLSMIRVVLFVHRMKRKKKKKRRRKENRAWQRTPLST